MNAPDVPAQEAAVVAAPPRHQLAQDAQGHFLGGFGTQQPDLTAREEGWHGQTHHLRLNLPPLSVLVLEPDPG